MAATYSDPYAMIRMNQQRQQESLAAARARATETNPGGAQSATASQLSPLTAGFPSSVTTRVTRNPEGTVQETNTPNLGPQEHLFGLERLGREQEGQSALETQRSKAETALLDQRARLAADAETRRLGYLPQVAAMTTQPEVQHDPRGDETAGRNAAFARAKEMAGQNAVASLNALKAVMEGSGTMGSSMEAAETGRIVGQAGGGVDEVIREQQLQDLSREADVADRVYQGRIAQRGQNMSMTPSLLALVRETGGIY